MVNEQLNEYELQVRDRSLLMISARFTYDGGHFLLQPGSFNKEKWDPKTEEDLDGLVQCEGECGRWCAELTADLPSPR